MAKVIPFLDGIVNLLKLSNVVTKRYNREPIENDLSTKFLDQSFSTEEGRDSIVDVHDFYEKEFFYGVKGFSCHPSALETYLHDYETCQEVSETYYTFNYSYYRRYYDSDIAREHARICMGATGQVPKHLEELCSSYRILANCYDILKEKPKVLKGKQKKVEKMKPNEAFYICNYPTACFNAVNVDVGRLIQNDISERRVKRRRPKMHEGDYKMEEDRLLAPDLSDKLKAIQELRPKKKNKAARERERKQREEEEASQWGFSGQFKGFAAFIKCFEKNQESCEAAVRKLEPSSKLPEGLRDPAIADVKSGAEYAKSIKEVVERTKALKKKGSEVKTTKEIAKEKSPESTEFVTEGEANVGSSKIEDNMEQQKRDLMKLLQKAADYGEPVVIVFEPEEKFGFTVEESTSTDVLNEMRTETEEKQEVNEPKESEASVREEDIDFDQLRKSLTKNKKYIKPLKRKHGDLEESFAGTTHASCVAQRTEPRSEFETSQSGTIVFHPVLSGLFDYFASPTEDTFGNNYQRYQDQTSIEIDRVGGSEVVVFHPVLNELLAWYKSAQRNTRNLAGPHRSGTVLPARVMVEYGSESFRQLLEYIGENEAKKARSFETDSVYEALPDTLRNNFTKPEFVQLALNILKLLASKDWKHTPPYHSKAVLLKGERALVEYWSVEFRNIEINMLGTLVVHPVFDDLLRLFSSSSYSEEIYRKEIGPSDRVDQSRVVVFHPALKELLGLCRSAQRYTRNLAGPHHSRAVRPATAVVEYGIEGFRQSLEYDKENKTIKARNFEIDSVHEKLPDSLRSNFTKPEFVQQVLKILKLLASENWEYTPPYHSKAVLLKGERALVEFVGWSAEFRNIEINMLETVVVHPVLDDLSRLFSSSSYSEEIYREEIGPSDRVDQSRVVVFHPALKELLGLCRSAQRNTRNLAGPYHSKAVPPASAVVEYGIEGFRQSLEYDRENEALKARNFEIDPVYEALLNSLRNNFTKPEFVQQVLKVLKLLGSKKWEYTTPYHSKAVLLKGERALVEYVDWSVEFRNTEVNMLGTVVVHPVLDDLLRFFSSPKYFEETYNGGIRPSDRVNQSRVVVLHPALKELLGWCRSAQRNTRNLAGPHHLGAVLPAPAMVEYGIEGFRQSLEYDEENETIKARNFEIDSVYEALPDSLRYNFTKLEYVQQVWKILKLLTSKDWEYTPPYHSKAVLLKGELALVEYIDWSVEFRNIEIDMLGTLVVHPVLNDLLLFFSSWSYSEEIYREEIPPSIDVEQTINRRREAPRDIHPNQITRINSTSLSQMNGFTDLMNQSPESQSTAFEEYLAVLEYFWDESESDDDILNAFKRCGVLLILRLVFYKALYFIDLNIDVVYLIALFIYLCVQFVIHY